MSPKSEPTSLLVADRSVSLALQDTERAESSHKSGEVRQDGNLLRGEGGNLSTQKTSIQSHLLVCLPAEFLRVEGVGNGT